MRDRVERLIFIPAKSRIPHPCPHDVTNIFFFHPFSREVNGEFFSPSLPSHPHVDSLFLPTLKKINTFNKKMGANICDRYKKVIILLTLTMKRLILSYPCEYFLHILSMKRLSFINWQFYHNAMCVVLFSLAIRSNGLIGYPPHL